MTISEITVEELAKKLKSNDQFILLDVRELSELEQAKITDARLEVAPMSRLGSEGTNALSESSAFQRRRDLCHVPSREPQYAGDRLAGFARLDECP